MNVKIIVNVQIKVNSIVLTIYAQNVQTIINALITNFVMWVQVVYVRNVFQIPIVKMQINLYVIMAYVKLVIKLLDHVQ